MNNLPITYIKNNVNKDNCLTRNVLANKLQSNSNQKRLCASRKNIHEDTMHALYVYN